jgi:hypothetical protein
LGSRDNLPKSPFEKEREEKPPSDDWTCGIRRALHLFNNIHEKAKQIGLARAKVECSIEELRKVCLTTLRESVARDLENLVEKWRKSADSGFCCYVLR